MSIAATPNHPLPVAGPRPGPCHPPAPCLMSHANEYEKSIWSWEAPKHWRSNSSFRTWQIGLVSGLGLYPELGLIRLLCLALISCKRTNICDVSWVFMEGQCLSLPVVLPLDFQLATEITFSSFSCPACPPKKYLSYLFRFVALCFRVNWGFALATILWKKHWGKNTLISWRVMSHKLISQRVSQAFLGHLYRVIWFIFHSNDSNYLFCVFFSNKKCQMGQL